MIFHLQSAGVPISWTIVAVYKGSYGIALHAAKSWQGVEAKDRETGPEQLRRDPVSPHYVVELKEKDGAWIVERENLLMDQAFLNRQAHDERNWLIQFGSSPLPISEDLQAALIAALSSKLKEFGYLISREEWERRYPAQKLVSDHFKAFSAAHKAFRDANDDEAAFPFELRFAPYMEAPKGFVFPYGVMQRWDGQTQSHTDWLVTKDGISIDELQPADEEQANTMMRLLNSGYRLEDIPVLLASEPVA